MVLHGWLGDKVILGLGLVAKGCLKEFGCLVLGERVKMMMVAIEIVKII